MVIWFYDFSKCFQLNIACPWLNTYITWIQWISRPLWLAFLAYYTHYHHRSPRSPICGASLHHSVPCPEKDLDPGFTNPKPEELFTNKSLQNPFQIHKIPYTNPVDPQKKDFRSSLLLQKALDLRNFSLLDLDLGNLCFCSGRFGLLPTAAWQDWLENERLDFSHPCNIWSFYSHALERRRLVPSPSSQRERTRTNFSSQSRRYMIAGPDNMWFEPKFQSLRS